LGSSKLLFTKMLEWTPEKTERFFVDVRNDLKNRGIHAFMPM
jgi:hypothetical protein